MDTTTTKARQLQAEWNLYKGLHYSQKTAFGPAVDIEIEKSACSQLVEHLTSGLLNPQCSEDELSFRTRTLEDHLRIFKDRITFEILRNGQPEEEINEPH